MLDHECVRKLTARWGSRFGASRSAMRNTPPRLGVEAWASVGEGASRTVASKVTAHRTAAGRGFMSYLLSTMRNDLDRTRPSEGTRTVRSLCSARSGCQLALLLKPAATPTSPWAGTPSPLRSAEHAG